MKVLVLSDSHGNLSNMMRAVEQESPRMILHLGDCWRDGERLHDRFPSLPLEQVYGNCDYLRGSREAEKLLCLGDKRGKTLFLNPGSIGDCARPTYGIVTLENGRLDARTVLLKG